MQNNIRQTIIFSSYDDIHNPYYGGGGAIAVHETAKRLAVSYEVTVITGNYPGAKNTMIDGVTYKRVGSAFGGPKVGQLIYQFVLPYYAWKESYTVWFESFTPPFSTGLLPLFTKKRIIGLVHMLSGADMKRKYHLPFDIVETYGLKAYKELVAPSDNMKASLVKAAPNARITTIMNGVQIVTGAVKTPKKHILFLGRIEIDQKGIDLLLEAWKNLGKKTRVPLVIAGGGEERQIALLKKLLTDMPNVRYIGKVTGKQKSDAIREALALIVPSRFETFSLTCLEALASGVPLISFAISGLSWIPDNARIKVPSFSVPDLTKALETVMRDAGLRRDLSEQGQKFGKKFTWDHTAQAYKALVTT